MEQKEVFELALGLAGTPWKVVDIRFDEALKRIDIDLDPLRARPDFQALLGGVPTVAYDVDGTREICMDHETGLLVPPGDRAKLRSAVVWMMDHPEEGKAMACRGRTLCRERFSAATMVERLEQIYTQILEHRSP